MRLDPYGRTRTNHPRDSGKEVRDSPVSLCTRDWVLGPDPTRVMSVGPHSVGVLGGPTRVGRRLTERTDW